MYYLVSYAKRTGSVLPWPARVYDIAIALYPTIVQLMLVLSRKSIKSRSYAQQEMRPSASALGRSRTTARSNRRT
jgi:hypothetical protein